MNAEDPRWTSIGYAEVADFHVAVARLDQPELGDRSILVGGDPAKRGKVVAASSDLRERGVVLGMSMAEALDRAPASEWVATNLPRAREVSGGLRASIRQAVPAIEIDGLAGFYFQAPSDHDQARDLAGRLGRAVNERTGLSLRSGIAPIRFAARWAAEDAGGEGVRFIPDDEFQDYLLRQPVARLPGVGPKTAARLAELGAQSVPEVRELGLERLEVLLGNHGRLLWFYASGEDPKPLRVRRHPETLSREETLTSATAEEGELRASLARLAASLAGALQRDGLRATRIALQWTDVEERTVTRSCTVEQPVDSAPKLLHEAERLLQRLDRAGGLTRRMGLILRGLEVRGAEERQLDLF